MEKLPVTALHIQRGRQMRAIVEHDIANGHQFTDAVDGLASHLGIDPEAVKLAIAIANEADGTGELLEVRS